MKKKSITKNEILQCGNEIIKNEGIRSLTIGKIVSTCGISKSTFYQYFLSKEELLLELKENDNGIEDSFYSIQEEIIHKAIIEFSNKPYEQIDIDTIAKAVGLKRTSIYKYFNSKEELLEISLRNEITNREGLEDELRSMSFDPVLFLERLFNYTITYTDKPYNNFMFYNALYYSKINSDINTVLNDLWASSVKLNEYVFNRGIEEGVFKKDIDTKLLAQMTLASMGGFAIFSYEQYRQLQEEYIKTILEKITIDKTEK
ncbi:TetR/AcrR family transcriptional regulator [Anaerosporobacter sp.]|uniref:TetR/AcrR family transcriptional regulator n=1 Tax=Anaerosporobacter sp. TaxID=1872529 RepID=UPI00286F0561|nr:TetR/AcrR family transcriptional regulator [Anaerosporobacter sp.]